MMKDGAEKNTQAGSPAKTKTILSAVFGCIALVIVLLCVALLAAAFLRTPFELAESIYDTAKTEWEGLFNLIGTLAAGTAEVLGMLAVLLFAYICSWVSLAFGTAAAVLSFNPCRSRLKLLGRITGCIGILYGLGAVILTAEAYLAP